MMAKENMENKIPKEEIAEENGRDWSFFLLLLLLLWDDGPGVGSVTGGDEDRQTERQG